MGWLSCWELGKKGRKRRLREREEGGGLLCGVGVGRNNKRERKWDGLEALV
jgi:hypothetical protein